jgi:PKD repeat protein
MGINKLHIALMLVLYFFTANTFGVCTSDFSYQPQSPQTIQFINESTSYNEGNIHYYWDFGDGNTSLEQNPENFYDARGIYKVSLTIITTNLCSSKITKDIFVGIPQSSPYCSLEINFETSNATYPNYNNGIASVYGFSDVPCCYDAQWSNGMYGETIYNLEPGTYCVTLSDEGSCFGSSCVTIGYNTNCQASFSVDSTTFSHLEGSYRFVNNSQGEEDYFIWDFGDGNSSYDYNPLHIYENPGTYEICLTIQTHYDCSDTFCKTITVGQTNPIIANLHGYVNAGDVGLPQGIAVLYELSQNIYSAIDYSLINNGYYLFDSLPKDKLYLTHLIPYFDLNEVYFPKYLPTYNDESTFWQESSFISLYTDTVVTTNLNSYNEIFYDNGIINGRVEYFSLSRYEESIFHRTWIENLEVFENYACNMVVLLKNENKEILDFCLTDNYGSYNFKNLDHGLYYLSVEKAGLTSDEILVDLSDDNSQSDNNNFVINQSSITGIEETQTISSKSIFPNPATDKIFILFSNSGDNTINIFDLTGKLVYSTQTSENLIEINLSTFLSGAYLIEVSNDNYTQIDKLIKL